MNSREATELGRLVASFLADDESDSAYRLLAPVLAERTPFRHLDRLGAAVGQADLEAVNRLLQTIAEAETEGGWVVIGSALGQQLSKDAQGAFDRCRGYIVAADVWYGADILGDRLPGPALIQDFAGALDLLAPWRHHPNRWVRRAVGVAAHFWAKRSRGAEQLRPQAERLLAFLEPMFEEWEMDAVKGVGWGLKTLGRHYPDTVSGWLSRQMDRPHRRLMVRKAQTYLPDAQTP